MLLGSNSEHVANDRPTEQLATACKLAPLTALIYNYSLHSN